MLFIEVTAAAAALPYAHQDCSSSRSPDANRHRPSLILHCRPPPLVSRVLKPVLDANAPRSGGGRGDLHAPLTSEATRRTIERYRRQDRCKPVGPPRGPLPSAVPSIPSSFAGLPHSSTLCSSPPRGTSRATFILAPVLKRLLGGPGEERGTTSVASRRDVAAERRLSVHRYPTTLHLGSHIAFQAQPSPSRDPRSLRPAVPLLRAVPRFTPPASVPRRLRRPPHSRRLHVRPLSRGTRQRPPVRSPPSLSTMGRSIHAAGGLRRLPIVPTSAQRHVPSAGKDGAPPSLFPSDLSRSYTRCMSPSPVRDRHVLDVPHLVAEARGPRESHPRPAHFHDRPSIRATPQFPSLANALSAPSAPARRDGPQAPALSGPRGSACRALSRPFSAPPNRSEALGPSLHDTKLSPTMFEIPLGAYQCTDRHPSSRLARSPF